MSLAVVGAGFGRTGTLSLKTALEKLGFGPCYHMLEVFGNPGHADAWAAAARGERTNWDALFANYRSAVDWPECHFWRQLTSHFSDAKVILSLRSPESWYKSVHETIYQSMIGPPPEDPAVRRQREMAYDIVVRRTFDERFEDKAHAISVFERHNEEVRATIPPHRLLVFEAAAGWEPLCAFLGVPVPDEPYPRVNTTEEFQARRLARAAEPPPAGRA